MKAKDYNILKEFAVRIRTRYPESQIWAFGSRARGTEDVDSDLDVCVVLNLLNREARAFIRQVAWEISYRSGIVITTVKYSVNAFSNGPSSASPLVHTILKEGIAA